MKNVSKKFIFKKIILWRLLTFLFLFFALIFIPLQKDFLGGGLDSYLKNPYFWAWSNFDGEHYLVIAYEGYRPLTYFFFPAYPFLVSFFGRFLGGSFTMHAVSAMAISHVAFFSALIGLWKLVLLDYRKNISKLMITLMLVFPTSFYFGSSYTESLFLALCVWSFYYARKGRWLRAGFLGAVLTATRVVGIALLPALAVELFLQKRGKGLKELAIPIIGVLLVPLGALIYMYYLKVAVGDPLEFLHSVEIFGQQRSSTLIMLPQVFYRYFFKVIPNINYNYFPVVFSTFLEISTALVFLALAILAFNKLRLSYAIYFALGYIIPTLSGSFSSFSRYVLVLFPAFLLMAIYISKLTKINKISIIIFSSILLFIATALFTRGFWIA